MTTLTQALFWFTFVSCTVAVTAETLIVSVAVVPYWPVRELIKIDRARAIAHDFAAEHPSSCARLGCQCVCKGHEAPVHKALVRPAVPAVLGQ